VKVRTARPSGLGDKGRRVVDVADASVPPVEQRGIGLRQVDGWLPTRTAASLAPPIVTVTSFAVPLMVVTVKYRSAFRRCLSA